MKKAGYADLPLHNGKVPRWLADRMAKLGQAVVEVIIMDYGKSEVLRRISDPMWFQSLGSVMGMDWHSSGITTSVMGALKRAINPMSSELGIYICGGRGKLSRQTPQELIRVANGTGLDSAALVRTSKLCAKIDNTAVQDGFHLYLHSFILSNEGEWAVVQQGMDGVAGMARRYHWHSAQLKSFVENPHVCVYGKNKGRILNLVDVKAKSARQSMLELSQENPSHTISEIRSIHMPRRHHVMSRDVDIRRLGSILALAKQSQIQDFESLLLLERLGPRTLQSLALVSEVIYGAPARFSDPARFSFAHGGKDGHPFPVPLIVYDKTIDVLEKALNRAKLGHHEKKNAIQRLSWLAQRYESQFRPDGDLQEVIQKERNDSWKYSGRTGSGHSQPPGTGSQMRLF